MSTSKSQALAGGQANNKLIDAGFHNSGKKVKLKASEISEGRCDFPQTESFPSHILGKENEFSL